MKISNIEVGHLGRDSFATTRWSIVAAAAGQASDDSKRALETLCTTYWYPLYAYAKRRTNDVAEAQDLTQAFFTELIEKQTVQVATPQRGRFRAFLLTAFKNFIAKQWQKARALKRGGGKTPIPLDFKTAESAIRIEPAKGLTPEEQFDRQWALTLLDRVMRQLQQEFDAEGKSEQYDTLKEFLIGVHSETSYATAAKRLGLNEAAARKAASRMRQRYRTMLRDEIAQTVTNPESIDDEIRNLFNTLAK